MRKAAVCFAGLLMLCSTAYAQYSTDFEDLDGSPAGVVLTGQDEYYLPNDTSVDHLVYTYADNALGIAANPTGGNQFVAGVGPAGGFFARAQRDINWGMGTSTWTVSFDAAAFHTDGQPGTNNIGSFSARLSTGPNSYIHLFSWDGPEAWQAFYLGYDAAGNQLAAPGRAPGPEWGGLQLNHWYRFTTDIHFGQNRITNVKITDLETGVCTESEFADVYMEGGDGGGSAPSNGFRFFAGGGVSGNGVAWDNTEVRRGFGECPTPCVPCDTNCDDMINSFDIEPFIALLFDENLPPCCGERGDIGGTGDTNGDGLVNAFDIEGFLECLFP